MDMRIDQRFLDEHDRLYEAQNQDTFYPQDGDKFEDTEVEKDLKDTGSFRKNTVNEERGLRKQVTFDYSDPGMKTAKQSTHNLASVVDMSSIAQRVGKGQSANFVSNYNSDQNLVDFLGNDEDLCEVDMG